MVDDSTTAPPKFVAFLDELTFHASLEDLARAYEPWALEEGLVAYSIRGEVIAFTVSGPVLVALPSGGFDVAALRVLMLNFVELLEDSGFFFDFDTESAPIEELALACARERQWIYASRDPEEVAAEARAARRRACIGAVVGALAATLLWVIARSIQGGALCSKGAAAVVVVGVVTGAMFGFLRGPAFLGFTAFFVFPAIWVLTFVVNVLEWIPWWPSGVRSVIRDVAGVARVAQGVIGLLVFSAIVVFALMKAKDALVRAFTSARGE